jgi:arabinose-5-phosphate isomerase
MNQTRTMNDDTLQELGLAVIKTEAEAVARLADTVRDPAFAQACRLMLDCKGRVVVTGMGKSGHIAGKLLPIIKRLHVPLIAMTGNPQSTLAREADASLYVGVEKEACPLDLAPTASTTAALAMGDALAVSLLQSRGFTEEDFARSHPGGSLGRRLLLLIDDIMHTDAAIPVVHADTLLSNALVEMTQKGLGMTAVVNADGTLAGVFTDGDLRRAIDHMVDVHTATISDVMTVDCKVVHPGMLAAEALQIMDSTRVNALPVVDDNRQLVGALNMHDLLRAGVV